MNDGMPLYFRYALECVGQKEVPGVQHNQLILRWWAAIKARFSDDETPWCAAFVGGCLEEFSIKSSRSGMARSYSRYGEASAMNIGAIVVLSRPGSAASGHVGFLAGVCPDLRQVILLGGNQGDAVSLARFDARRIVAMRVPTGWRAVVRTPAPVYAAAAKLSFSINEA